MYEVRYHQLAKRLSEEGMMQSESDEEMERVFAAAGLEAIDHWCESDLPPNPTKKAQEAFLLGFYYGANWALALDDDGLDA